MHDVIGSILLAMVGLAIGVPSFFTRSHHWPGMIAGFDKSRYADVDGLTTWIGTVGMLLAATCVIAAGAFMVPQFRTATTIVLGVALLAGVVASISSRRRFIRR